MNYLRRIYLGSAKKFKHFLPAHKYVAIQYEYYNKKKIDIYNPTEFNQKIQWMKAFYHPPILHKLVDKYAVREYVEEKIGAAYLNGFVAVYDKVSEIDFEKLPQQFAMKVVNGCGYNLIVPDKSKLNVRQAKWKLLKWTSRDQYRRSGKEWAYKGVKPRILVEHFMKQENKNSLNDYKFYCFNGKPRFVEIHLDRSEAHRSSFYDLEFKKLPFRDVKEEETIQIPLEKPKRFEEMVTLAEKLADRLPFVRVDFYYVDEQIKFGEMTFYPGDGRADFQPEKYNKLLGDMLELPEIPKGKNEIVEY